ncbi:hypothetical protein BB559_006225 [Furculomyces boomerangus]|nr:hypothetical protein BB559_006225 [Furculomyces boomerangus]PWA01383.1 hypothetical protein BB558_002521 [Smittium angustum]
MEEITFKTKDNNGPVLNICIPYLSTHEISTAISSVSQQVSNGTLDPEDITESLIESNLFTNDSPQLELIIRTSGETRLSNFLLWQASKNVLIKFVDVYWPEFTLLKLVGILLDYQIEKLQQKE